MNAQLIFGSSVTQNPVPQIREPLLTLPGRAMSGERGFPLSEDLLSRHLLLLGGSGCGKTNTFFFLVDALRRRMTEKDVAIIFDTKGEYYEKFARPGDLLLGNSTRFRSASCTWNIFDEILADGWGQAEIDMNSREIAAALFRDRGSSTQPFFCDAARDIFRGILQVFLRQAKNDPEAMKGKLNNAELLKHFRQFKAEQYIELFKAFPDLRFLLSYIGDGKTGQALGVFGELNSMLSDYFVGILAEHRPEKSLSMRQFVRQRGGRAIFVEYDLSLGETLTPMYRLLIDQALKEALGRGEGQGNVFLIADEFKLLPKLQHIDDALNFGRGLGVRVVAGIQSIDQLYEIYGREKGAVIAGGFGSLFAYHTNDASSREYISGRFGKNIMVYSYVDRQRNRMTEDRRDGNTVEEWDQMTLGLGQAVIGLGYDPPFLFEFDEYKK